MNDDPMTDSEVRSLEGRLSAIQFQLPEYEQQLLLYRCAFAAGRSTAQRACARRMRRWIGATSLLALLCFGLSYRLMTLTQDAASSSREDVPVARAVPDARLDVEVSHNSNDSRQLSVVTPFDRVVNFNWPPRPGGQTGDSFSADDRLEPVWTPMLRTLPDIP